MRQLRPELIVEGNSARLEFGLRRRVLVKALVQSPRCALAEGTFAHRAVSKLLCSGYQRLNSADQRREGGRSRIRIYVVRMIEPKGGSYEALLIVARSAEEAREKFRQDRRNAEGLARLNSDAGVISTGSISGRDSVLAISPNTVLPATVPRLSKVYTSWHHVERSGSAGAGSNGGMTQWCLLNEPAPRTPPSRSTDRSNFSLRAWAALRAARRKAF